MSEYWVKARVTLGCGLMHEHLLLALPISLQSKPGAIRAACVYIGVNTGRAMREWWGWWCLWGGVRIINIYKKERENERERQR